MDRNHMWSKRWMCIKFDRLGHILKELKTKKENRKQGGRERETNSLLQLHGLNPILEFFFFMTLPLYRNSLEQICPKITIWPQWEYVLMKSSCGFFIFWISIYKFHLTKFHSKNGGCNKEERMCTYAHLRRKRDVSMVNL